MCVFNLEVTRKGHLSPVVYLQSFLKAHFDPHFQVNIHIKGTKDERRTPAPRNSRV